MFENVLGQRAVDQLAADVAGGRLAPSILFRGPEASGKGTAALELGRVLSCEGPAAGHAAWDCPCPACAKHRRLNNPDLLVLGPRSFSAEISASAAAFARERGQGSARTLFIRAVRKLLLRFNPVLWDDDPKAARIAPLVEALDADLDELMAGGDFTEKQRESLLKDAYKLEAEGIAEMIPVSQIRQAAWWCRTAPLGRRKLLLIENAGRMLDAARNSLLKLLEEPPDRVNILLSTVQGDALLPTIRSRLRPYRFMPRDAAVEQEIIRRVFRDPEPGAGTTAGGLREYLNAFLPVSRDRLLPLAACFAASLARQCVPSLRGRALRRELPPPLVSLGKLCAALAETALAEPALAEPARAETAQDCGAAIQAVMAGAEKFEAPGLFNLFLESLLGLASRSLRESATLPGPSATVLADIFRSLAAEAAAAVGSYNQNPAQALERFAVEFKQRAAALV